MRKVGIDDMRPQHPAGTVGVDFRPLLGGNVSAPNFYLRIFDVAPGGHTPDHSHPWEHELFVVEGSGEIVLGSRKEAIKKGEAILIEPNEKHMFRNDSDSLLRLVCVIPKP